MEKLEFDIERVKKHFRGEKNDLDYLCRLFIENRFNDDLDHALRLEWYDEKHQDIPEKNLDHILYKINYEINQKQSQSKSFSSQIKIWFSRVAAILLLPLLIYTAYNIFNKEVLKEAAWVEINSPAWGRVQFSLPDGSKGWLNSNSRLKYREDFFNNREVMLNGEAYFDVRSDKRNHFKVLTADIVITVHGTKFNVESYKSENAVEVTLEEGIIDYYNKSLNRLYKMQPNGHIYYDKLSGNLNVDVVEPEKYTAWKDGKLIFRNDPLDVVARRLGRWYNIDVEVRGNISNQPMLRATFVDENLEQVLKLLKKSRLIDYTIIKGEKKGDTYGRTKVIISSKNI
jgi:transmembrane sensor